MYRPWDAQVIVVAATIVWGVIAARSQAALAFRLEAAKTLISADTYADQVVRASFLREFFANELGSDFLSKLSYEDFPDAGKVAAKLRFINLIAGRGLTPEETGQLYHIMLPDDKELWSKDVQALLKSASARPR